MPVSEVDVDVPVRVVRVWSCGWVVEMDCRVGLPASSQ
jgi:hypothetical protein